MEELAIKIEHVTKQYRLGTIGGGTLRGDLQSFIARKRGLEDPNSKIGSKQPAKVGERFLALDDISFEVRKGELFAFLGVNGAGKSTTINIMCGQLRKDNGNVIINGESVDEGLAKIKSDIGVVFQKSLLDRALSVRDNLESRAALYGIYGQEFEERLKELSKLLDFGNLLRRTLGKLSGGQRRRIRGVFFPLRRLAILR